MSRPPLKTQQLADQLAKRIASGEWEVGAWLPSERQLADEYNAARGTVRAALEALIATGMVEAETGAGVRVARQSDREGEVTLDAVAVGEQLRAIRDELGAINTRLQHLEKRPED